jgi:hypothetical protein
MDISKNIVVEYEDSAHQYSLEGIRYRSASQIVGMFHEKFDAVAVATKYAAKNGGTPEYWMSEWKNKCDVSLERGNTIHDANELALNARMIDIVNGKELVVQGDRYDDTYPWFERPDGVYTERKLWHHGYRCAGRSDKVILRTAESVRYADVEDYKTNAEIKMVSYQYKSGQFKMMNPPLGHIMDCNFWHYTLQLSIYMFMLEYQGFTPGQMHIIHYPHPTQEHPKPERIRIPVEYRKREVIAMLTFLNR